MLGRGRWFFLQISGRRRIGKTRLVQELLQPQRRERMLYIQIPDSDPAGVVSTARDFMESFGVSAPLPHDLRSLAVRISELCAEGWIVALDEFQTFSRKALFPFTSELQSELDRLAATPGIGSQVAGYLKTLEEKYELVEKRLPVFAKPKARKGHYTIRDNFLRCWLDALAVPTAAINFRPLEGLVEQADHRLMKAEGYGLERLVGQLYEERSRLGLGDFPLTSRIEAWWDRSDTEIDLVALDATAQRLRLGSCKRSAAALVAELGRFDSHVARFLHAFPSFLALAGGEGCDRPHPESGGSPCDHALPLTNLEYTLSLFKETAAPLNKAPGRMRGFDRVSLRSQGLLARLACSFPLLRSLLRHRL